jgi:hypothetical protein
MIYRTTSVLIISAFFLMTGIISAPASGGQVTDTPQILPASDITFEGLLALKEADGVFIVRSENGKKKRFTLNKNTMITRNGKTVSYKDLRSRDQVRVNYNSDFVVTEIQASGP